MIVFSRGRAAPHIAKAAAARRVAVIGFYRKFEATNKRGPTQGEVAAGVGITPRQAHDVIVWMKKHGEIKAVAK